MLLDFFFPQPPPMLTLHHREHVFILPLEGTKTEVMLWCTQMGVFITQDKQQADIQPLIETHNVLS